MSATPVFTVGGEDDPVVQMALQLNTRTFQITITNNSGWALSPGLASTSALYTEEKVASAALAAFSRQANGAAADPLKLAQALGVIMGAGGYYIPALAPGQSVTLALTVPFANALSGKMSYVARVVNSDDDFVGVNGHQTSSGNNGFSNLAISGYDIDDGNGATIKRGNGTTGADVNVTGEILDITECDSTRTMTKPATLINETFATSTAYDHTWPFNIGFDGDFNGDWYTDGKTARMIEGPVTASKITGFVKFLNVCPTPGATVSVTADIATRYKQQGSDTTLVVYFFNESSQVISTAENHPLHGRNDRKHALYEVAVPIGTRKVAFVPMGLFVTGETDSSHYYNLKATYEPAGTVTKTALTSDDFSQYGASAYGTNQPNGWADYGGDWYTNPADGHATVWNPAWNGDAGTLPKDTGMTKTFSLSGVALGSALTARAFAASTFTDPASQAQLRLKFNGGQELSASPIATLAWGMLDVYRQPIPAGATSVTVTLQIYLAAGETSSAYVDDLQLWTTK